MDFYKIFQSQKLFFQSQKTKDIYFRKRSLLKLKDIIKSNEKEFYDAIYRDFQKSPFDTYSTELGMIYKDIDYFLKNIDKLSKPKNVFTNIVNLPGNSRIYYEPLGCTLVIGAWNYPYQLTFLPLISSIAAGNTCIIKPSELTENVMRLIAKIVNDNFHSEYIFVVEGGIEETTEVLKLKFDKIFFTGSTKVGRIVYQAAAKNLTPVTLELGGKSPVIVTKEADLEIAAKRIVWGKFINAGQTCVAPDYLLVHKDIKPKLLKLIKDRLEISNYVEGAEHYVNIINRRNFDRILNLLDKSKICYGGLFNEKTLYIQPTVMDMVTWEDTIMQEEIFGPILPIITFSDLDEVLDLVIKQEKPLSAYLFSNNNKEKQLFVNKIPFGGGCINDVIMHLTNDNMPFGGVGASGMGNYHGEFGFKTFSHQKSILEKFTCLEPDLKYPPYNNKKLKWIKRLV